jgi:hypothetical protein
MGLAGWALCHGLASLHADGLLLEPGRGQPRDVLAQADALVNMLMHGVCTRPPTQSKQS